MDENEAQWEPRVMQMVARANFISASANKCTRWREIQRTTYLNATGEPSCGTSNHDKGEGNLASDAMHWSNTKRVVNACHLNMRVDHPTS